MSTKNTAGGMTDSERESLAGFHKTISEQLNTRLAESPKFFGLLVVTGTAYGYVLLKFKEVEFPVFVLASVLAYVAIFWSLWYLAALGYAFRYLQNSQHRIEDEIGWGAYRNKTTGIPPNPCWRLSYAFWLLPGIYHAHAFGLTALLVIVTGGFFYHWPGARNVAIGSGILTALASIGLVLALNIHYVRKFSVNRLPPREDQARKS